MAWCTSRYLVRAYLAHGDGDVYISMGFDSLREAKDFAREQEEIDSLDLISYIYRVKDMSLVSF